VAAFFLNGGQRCWVVRVAHTPNLGFVFPGFHQRDRTRIGHEICTGQQVLSPSTHGSVFHPYTLPLVPQLLQNRGCFVIVPQLHALAETTRDWRGYLAGIDKQDRGLQRHERGRDKDGVKWNVGAPKIEQPRDTVKRRNEVRVGIPILHFLSDAPEFCRYCFSCKACGQCHDGTGRSLRAIGPYGIDEVRGNTLQPSASGLHRELDFPCAPDRNRLRIDPCHLAISKILLKELRQRWHTRLSHSKKPDTTSGELIFRLQVVAAVRPQTGIANRYQNVAHRPGESADPWTSLPAHRNVFTLVRI
jgi:hypothetical protein